ncbi:hypothetical protein AX15_004452 [Amanita polypyramis BW_CC]|nr:hypothetical protein AX15_004452 [Amanita polypyramis BW_CC]
MESLIGIPSGLPSLGTTIGAAFLGTVAAAVLHGCIGIQSYLYFKNYPQDRPFQKYAVAFLWIMDSLHMALTIVEMWHYLINSFGDYIALLHITWSCKLQVAINVVIILAVQSLYTLRVWKLSSDRARIWAWILIAVLMAGYATGIILVVKLYSVTSFLQLDQFRWAIYLSFAMPTFNDFLLSAGICHVLSLRRTVFAETRSRIWIIMCYVVISGVLTSVCSLIALVMYCVMPNNLIFLGIEFLLTKLYVNSYLALLNARKSVRERSISNASNAMHLSDMVSHNRSVRSADETEPKLREQNSAMNSRSVKIRVDVVQDGEQLQKGNPYAGFQDGSPRSGFYEDNREGLEKGHRY